jgi:hypothetical protein
MKPARRKNAMTLDCDKLHAYLGQRRCSGVGEFDADKIPDDENEQYENPRISAHVVTSWRSDGRI